MTLDSQVLKAVAQSTVLPVLRRLESAMALLPKWCNYLRTPALEKDHIQSQLWQVLKGIDKNNFHQRSTNIKHHQKPWKVTKYHNIIIKSSNINKRLSSKIINIKYLLPPTCRRHLRRDVHGCSLQCRLPEDPDSSSKPAPSKLAGKGDWKSGDWSDECWSLSFTSESPTTHYADFWFKK